MPEHARLSEAACAAVYEVACVLAAVHGRDAMWGLCQHASHHDLRARSPSLAFSAEEWCLAPMSWRESASVVAAIVALAMC